MRFLSLFFLLFLSAHSSARQQLPLLTERHGQPIHRDTAFQQDYSVKYTLEKLNNKNTVELKKVLCDRNGVVQIYSSRGLLTLSGGKFLYPGKIIHDVSYPAMAQKNIANIGIYKNQFIYVDDKAVLSNAWAGKLFIPHSLPSVKIFSPGNNFSFLLSDGKNLQYLQDSKILFTGSSQEDLLDILYDDTKNIFWLLGKNQLEVFNPSDQSISVRFQGEGFTSFSLVHNNHQLIIGTGNGYIILETDSGKPIGTLQNRLPCSEITVVKEIGGRIWFGSNKGAFFLQENGKYKYYESKRWLPSDHVNDISLGSQGQVLVLTDKGLAQIHFENMTLEDKVQYFEKQVRLRHIHYGFNATLSRMKEGDVQSGSLEDSDNDGLWTSMYLGAEVFRYAATKSKEALENCRESLDAMERLYTITEVKGFPARSYERRGFEISDVTTENSGKNTGSGGNAGVQPPFEIWRHAANPEWDWKSTTSSDEAIGHMFVFGAIAELIDVPEIRNKAIRLMDALMQHIVDHKMYLYDWNGEPTTWGRWNPEYVNARPKNVGDRKITSSNITSMLQTAYHFTGKKIYKDKALELLNKYGFLENLMRPMKEIGHAPDSADALSKDLSDGWNHSDDEMYFLGYWGLYRYALNDTLKRKFKAAILDHWQIERPEKEGAWDIFTAITGVRQFDLGEAIWYLQKYPLDLISWKVGNGQRQDIEFIPNNFRKQYTREVLPPDELPISRHNGNRFDLDGGDENGGAEYSAGDIWLLPYWMGRYLKVISAASPVKSERIKSAIIPSSTKNNQYSDLPFSQRYSIKYYQRDSSIRLSKIAMDHNGNIQILSTAGLLKPGEADLLNSGQLVKDKSYTYWKGKNILDLGFYKDEFIYADNKAIFSNAWAGNISISHGLPGVSHLAGGRNFDFLVSGENQLKYVAKKEIYWSGEVNSQVLDIQFLEARNEFIVLTSGGLYAFSPQEKKLKRLFSGEGFTCFRNLPGRIMIGTHQGYFQLDGPEFMHKSGLNQKLPCTDITIINFLAGNLWFGSTHGAFMLRKDHTFDYYASERWLPGDEVLDIQSGDEGSVLILTQKGLGKLAVQITTLEQKAAFYESIVRHRHIRYGIYCDYTDLEKTDSTSFILRPHDSDNLWTAMYLSGELFRYLVTQDEEAKENCEESLDAMERLFTLSGIRGLFGRSFERSGIMEFRREPFEENVNYWYPGYVNMPSSWRHVPGGEWDWRGSASSDQAVGQYFTLTMAAAYMKDSSIKRKAIKLIDELTGYILENDLKLIDVTGKPTLWGIWSPEYVNRFPTMVGDRKLYSSNIISFLQIAWHFTGKEKYRTKALELLYRNKYLENLTRPIHEIGPAPANADKWSQLMSGGWNFSDDEMYFLAYFGLSPYALDNKLRSKYNEAIRDHWENLIKPEKDALWNFIYMATTGASEFDLPGCIWELKRMPMDLRTWGITNSIRKDLNFIPKNNLDRMTREVLPPDERPENKHNRNLFNLDDKGTGASELGGGDVYLLPYWMGRYFGKISAPRNHPDSKGSLDLLGSNN